MTSEIRYDPEAVAFTVDGSHEILISGDDAVVAPLAALAEAEVSSFETALGEYEEQDAATVNYVFLSDTPVDEFDPDISDRHVGLTFLGGRLSAEAGHLVGEGIPALNGEALLAPLLDRHNAEHAGSYPDDQGGRDFEIHSLRLLDDGRTLRELFALAVEAQALVDAAQAEGELTALTARDLIKAGRVSVLLGQPETSWIDAKVQPHDISGEKAKWELAKDVAAFANTGRDAIIVFGVEAAMGPSGEVLDRARAFELSGFDVEAARAVLRQRLTPILPDIDLQVVEDRGGHGYGWVFIPAQPTDVRPVMVSGVFVDGHTQGSHVSVPIRVGEDTAHWDASRIHSLIQAGRVALGGETASQP